MHLVVIKCQILCEHVVYLPRKKDAGRKKACVDRQAADKDAGREHTDDVEARGDNCHVAGEIDDRIVRLAYKPKADDGQNGRHAVDGNAQAIRSGVVPAFPIADDALVLRVGKKRIEKVREPSDVKHDESSTPSPAR